MRSPPPGSAGSFARPPRLAKAVVAKAVGAKSAVVAKAAQVSRAEVAVRAAGVAENDEERGRGMNPVTPPELLMAPAPVTPPLSAAEPKAVPKAVETPMNEEPLSPSLPIGAARSRDLHVRGVYLLRRRRRSRSRSHHRRRRR